MTTRVLPSITLKALTPAGRETFITENQRSFNYGALEEFGQRNADFEEEGQIISRATIEDSIDQGQAYQILAGGRPVGGLVVQVEEDRGTLDLLFIAPEEHSKGYGQAAWAQVEETYPAVTAWETFTPYFETRNVHFYVNKLGFEILEFYHQQHPNPMMGRSRPARPQLSAGKMTLIRLKSMRTSSSSRTEQEGKPRSLLIPLSQMKLFG